MKKILFSLLTLSSVTTLSAQIFQEDFEDSTSIDGWTMYKDTNTVYSSYQEFLNNAWNLVQLNSDPKLGNSALSSTSWFTSSNKADRWGVTPVIDLSNYSDLSLKFDVRASDEAPWNDGLIIKISTTGNDKESFIDTLYDTTTNEIGESENWNTRTVDLSAYIGEKIYLAFINQWEDGNILQVDNIIVDGTLAVSEVSKPKVAVYPNPVQDEFKLNLSQAYNAAKVQVTVTDLTGRKVKSFSAGEIYNVSGLSKGVYIVTVTDGTNKFTQKLIKK